MVEIIEIMMKERKEKSNFIERLTDVPEKERIKKKEQIKKIILEQYQKLK